MAPKFVLVALVSVLVLFVGEIPAKVSAVTAPTPTYTAIAIGGEVFCKSCKLPGYVSYLDASPVNGPVVRVSCFDKNWKIISVSTTTNPGGFFYMTWTDTASFDPSRCKAYIDWSPLSFCNVPIYGAGNYGANLYLAEEKTVSGGKQATYSPGVIFLEPPSGAKCPAIP